MILQLSSRSLGGGSKQDIRAFPGSPMHLKHYILDGIKISSMIYCLYEVSIIKDYAILGSILGYPYLGKLPPYSLLEGIGLPASGEGMCKDLGFGL